MKPDILVKGLVIAIVGLPILYCGDYAANNMAAVSQSGNTSLHDIGDATSYLGLMVFIIGIIMVLVGLFLDPKKAGTIGFCSRCGNQLKPRAVSCPKCGRKL